MNELEYDQALSKFLDDERCETVNEVLFELIRSAFAAGWKAAMGSDLKQVINADGRNA